MSIDLLQRRKGDVTYGITFANRGRFTPVGFSISKTDALSWSEVYSCRAGLAIELGFTPDTTHWQHQVHGVALKEIRADEKHPMNHTETPTDGLYTFDTNRLLCVSVADCCGVVLWNDDVMCAVHSGWKGTQQNIVSAMIDVVESRGISPRMLNVWLSPCATKRSYIVRSDVANYFPNHVQQVGDDQFLFDNHGAIREQVLERGVDSASITVCDECTMESYEYHSHRRDRDNAGRMAVFIGRSDGR